MHLTSSKWVKTRKGTRRQEVWYIVGDWERGRLRKIEAEKERGWETVMNSRRRSTMMKMQRLRASVSVSFVLRLLPASVPQRRKNWVSERRGNIGLHYKSRFVFLDVVYRKCQLFYTLLRNDGVLTEAGDLRLTQRDRVKVERGRWPPMGCGQSKSSASSSAAASSKTFNHRTSKIPHDDHHHNHQGVNSSNSPQLQG